MSDSTIMRGPSLERAVTDFVERCRSLARLACSYAQSCGARDCRDCPDRERCEGRGDASESR